MQKMLQEVDGTEHEIGLLLKYQLREDYHEKTQSGLLVFRLRLESWRSRIPGRNAIHRTATLFTLKMKTVRTS
jgi:hypothetical protein